MGRSEYESCDYLMTQDMLGQVILWNWSMIAQ
jgi:hypothetical protein